jgi:coenzyme F420-reducing hydrogenase delta subunit
VEYAKELLEMIGLEGQRLQMFNLSAAMAGQFVTSASEMTSLISELGPNPLKRVAAQEEHEEIEE